MEEGAPALEIAVRASTGHRGGLISAEDFDLEDAWWYAGDPLLYDEEAWERGNPDAALTSPADNDPFDDHILFLDEAEIGQVLDRIARQEVDTWSSNVIRDGMEDIKRLDALDPSLLEHVARSELERDPRYPWFDLLARALFAQGRWAEAQEAMLRERPEIEPDDPAHVQQFIELVQSRIERSNVPKAHEYLVDSVNAARERYRDLDHLLTALSDLAQLDTSSMNPGDVLLPQQAWARLALRLLVRASRATGWYPRRAWFDLDLRGHLGEVADPYPDSALSSTDI